MYETIIEYGIIFLLIYTPLAFGGVSQRSISLLEVVSALLFIIWLAKIISPRRKKRRLPTDKHHLVLISIPFMVALLLFLTLILLQLIPLPDFLVKIISPTAYQLYAEGASSIDSTLPNLLPLSVCTQATETELYKFLAYAAVFFLIINNIRTSKQVNRLVSVIIAVGFIESLYGLIQFVSGQHFIYSYKLGSSWVHGTFVNKNHFAGYLEMVILVMFGMLFTRFEKRHSSPRRNIERTFEEKYMKGFFVLFVLFIMIGAHLLSGSRGGIISFSSGIIFFTLLVSTRRLLRKWIVIVLIFVPLAFGSIMAANPELLSERLSTLKQLESNVSFRVRWELWRSAVHIFQDYPVVGSGFGTFSHLARRYKTFRWKLRFNYPENDYVQLLSETGMIGSLLVLWMGSGFFYHTLTAWKRRHSRWAVAIAAGGLSAMFSLAIHSCTDFNLHIPSNAFLFSVIAALCYVTAHIQKSRRAEDKRVPTPVPSQEGKKVEDSKQDNTQYSIFNIQYSMYSMIVLVVVFVLVVLYLFRVTKSYYAFGHYQEVSKVISQENLASVETTQYDQITDHLKTAIRHDRNHAEYFFALGSFLSRYSVDTQDPEAIKHKEQRFQEAKGWLRKAIRFDPANPWYYYEMGLLSYSRGDCHNWRNTHPTESWDACPVTRYFLAALQNAPKDMFLREAVGRWYYYDDPEATAQLMRAIISSDMENTPERAGIVQEFSKFLYEIRMDSESDREAERARHLAKEEALEECQANVVPQGEAEEQKLRRAEVKKDRRIELGNDDGSAEWKTVLTSETQRVKKVICLPENLDGYDYAALKVLMNSSDNRNFSTHISVDDQRIKQYPCILPRVRNWHEIPFDIALLQGKSRINVYIRVTNTSETGDYLEVWGDQDTPNRYSVLNFDTKNDLSADDGIQSGEYMIRLVLKKL